MCSSGSRRVSSSTSSCFGGIDISTVCSKVRCCTRSCGITFATADQCSWSCCTWTSTMTREALFDAFLDGRQRQVPDLLHGTLLQDHRGQCRADSLLLGCLRPRALSVPRDARQPCITKASASLRRSRDSRDTCLLHLAAQTHFLNYPCDSFLD